MILTDESSFPLLPTSGRIYFCRTHKEAYNPECLAPTVKHRMLGQQYCGMLMVPFLPFMAELLQGVISEQ
jgi:hypothetical protein